MFKKVILVLIAFMFLLSSCALPGGSKKEEPAPVKEEAVVEEPVQEPMEEVAMEEPVEEVLDEEPTQEEVVADEPAEEDGVNFRDDFDIPTDSWSDDFILTTQAPNADQIQTQPSEVQDGVLMWKIRDKETFIYKWVNDSMAEDVVIESKWVSKGQSQNGIALLCRVSEDKSSWYEARISAQGDWQVLKYDRSIRENDAYKNPFVTIKKGVAKLKLVRPTSDNITIFSCVGPKLTFEVNGTKLVETNNVDLKGGGMVGMGVMSSHLVQAQIDFDYFSASAPE
jgi:hypothetical protein